MHGIVARPTCRGSARAAGGIGIAGVSSWLHRVYFTPKLQSSMVRVHGPDARSVEGIRELGSTKRQEEKRRLQ
jgi:hypothetical protein